MHWRNETEKFCILVCAKLHDVGCSLLGPCQGLYATDIAKRMAARGIAISVISPTRNAKVDAIFDAVIYYIFVERCTYLQLG